MGEPSGEKKEKGNMIERAGFEWMLASVLVVFSADAAGRARPAWG